MSEKTPDVKEPLATFKQRAMAGLLDYLVPIVFVICGSILFATNFTGDAFVIVGGVVCQLAALLIWVGNFIFRVYKFKGQTMGKQRQHITTKKIVDKEKWILEDLGEGDIGLIIGRAIVSWIEVFFIIPIIVPYLMLSSSNNNQTLSDRIFGTVVVQIDPDEYDPKKKGEEDGKAVDGKTTTAKKTTDKTTTSKTAQTIEGENNTLAMISKFVLIGGFILPILYLFLSFLNSFLGTIWFSIIAWGGVPLPNLDLLGKTVNAFGIMSYICFFIITGAIIMLALQYSGKIQTNLLVSGGLFGGFTIFWIIANHAQFDYRLFVLFGSGIIGTNVGRVVFWILAIIALIVSLFFFNKYIKLINEEHGQEIRPFIGQIALIIFLSLRFIVWLIGVIAIPTDAFGATIYYLQKLFVWMAIITMMITFAGFAFRALKLDTKKIPAKS